MLLNEAANGKLMNRQLNWPKGVEQCLSLYGFGYVWLAGGRVNENSFVKSLKRRLQDCYRQEWHAKINESQRFAVYSSFKKGFHFENYSHDLNIKKFRDTFVRFRLGNIPLGANLRFTVSNEERMCPFCKEFLG